MVELLIIGLLCAIGAVIVVGALAGLKERGAARRARLMGPGEALELHAPGLGELLEARGVAPARAYRDARGYEIVELEGSWQEPLSDAAPLALRMRVESGASPYPTLWIMLGEPPPEGAGIPSGHERAALVARLSRFSTLDTIKYVSGSGLSASVRAAGLELPWCVDNLVALWRHDDAPRPLPEPPRAGLDAADPWLRAACMEAMARAGQLDAIIASFGEVASLGAMRERMTCALERAADAGQRRALAEAIVARLPYVARPGGEDDPLVVAWRAASSAGSS